MPAQTSAASNSIRVFRRWAILLGVLLPLLWGGWTLRRMALDKELIDAIRTEDAKTVIYCLKSGADPNTRDLEEAKFDEREGKARSFEEMMDWLRHSGQKQTPQFHNPALIALFEDQTDRDRTMQEKLEVARALLDRGANVNARNVEGATALILALHWKWNKTAQLLLDRGADIHLKGIGGTTALMKARGELAEELIRRGADVHAVDQEGWTALHCAAQAADLIAIRALIAQGAEVDAGTQGNDTPLLEAAWSRHPDSLEAMKLLLVHGADIRAKTSVGITVLMYAARSGDAKKVEFVLSQGADKTPDKSMEKRS